MKDNFWVVIQIILKMSFEKDNDSEKSHQKFGVLPFRLIFTVSFRVTICLGLGKGLGIGLGSGLGKLGLGEMGLGKMGLGEMGQNQKFTQSFSCKSANKKKQKSRK